MIRAVGKVRGETVSIEYMDGKILANGSGKNIHAITLKILADIYSRDYAEMNGRNFEPNSQYDPKIIVEILVSSHFFDRPCLPPDIEVTGEGEKALYGLPCIGGDDVTLPNGG